MNVYFKCPRDVVFPPGGQSDFNPDWLCPRLLSSEAVKSMLVGPETWVQSGQITQLTPDECLVCFVPFALENQQFRRKFGMRQTGDFPFCANDSGFFGLRDGFEYQTASYVFFYNRSGVDTAEQVITDFVNAVKNGKFDDEPQHKYQHCAVLTIVDGASATPAAQ